MAFILKKFISQFLMPIPFVVVLYLGGWLLVRFTVFKKIGRMLILSAIACFLLFGYGVGSDRYLYRLERTYSPVELNTESIEKCQEPSIVVLGQGLPEKSDLPLRYQTTPSFQMRLQEGARLYKELPRAQLFISLAGEVDVAIKQQYLDTYAKDHGLVRERMYVISEARDTSDEARLALDRMKAKSLFVVTSASHLPRAVKIFTKELEHRKVPYRVVTVEGVGCGCQNRNELLLVPVPSDYTAVAPCQYSFHVWALPLPSLNGFNTFQRALYEWLGNMYEDLKK